MKLKIALSILIVAMIFSSLSLFAHGGEDHEQMKTGEEMMSPAAIWQNIREEEKELEEVIKVGKLGEVHEIAFTIRDLANMLLEHSKGHAGVPVGLLMTQVNQIGSIAESLDQYGDAGDKSKTEEQFQRLQNVLNTIEAQYPHGVLANEHH